MCLNLFRKRKASPSVCSHDGDVDRIYDKARKQKDDEEPFEIIKTVYNADGDVRCVFIKHKRGYIRYSFQMLTVYEGDETCRVTDSNARFWMPYVFAIRYSTILKLQKAKCIWNLLIKNSFYKLNVWTADFAVLYL